MKESILNTSVYERIIAFFVLIFLYTKGKDVNVYVIYVLLILTLLIGTRRFIINRKEGKSNQRFSMALVFMILSLAMSLFI